MPTVFFNPAIKHHVWLDEDLSDAAYHEPYGMSAVYVWPYKIVTLGKPCISYTVIAINWSKPGEVGYVTFNERHIEGFDKVIDILINTMGWEEEDVLILAERVARLMRGEEVCHDVKDSLVKRGMVKSIW